MTRQLCEQCESSKAVAWDHEWQGYLCFSCAQELADVSQYEARSRFLLDGQDLQEGRRHREPVLRSP
jgi:hypothetical protein